MALFFSLLWIIAGLPWTAWLLWMASVGIGLVIVIVFFLRQSRSSPSE